MSNHHEPDLAGSGTTRRQALRRFVMTGLMATAGAGLSELLTARGAAAAVTPTRRLSAAEALAILPADAPESLAQAIASGCCLHFTRAEGACGAPCPAGQCCYTWSGCTSGGPICLNYTCIKGNFSTGC